jgi:hypothetical protein
MGKDHQLRRWNLLATGLWCDMIVLNVHAPTEDESDDTKNSFCED